MLKNVCWLFTNKEEGTGSGVRKRERERMSVSVKEGIEDVCAKVTTKCVCVCVKVMKKRRPIQG